MHTADELQYSLDLLDETDKHARLTVITKKTVPVHTVTTHWTLHLHDSWWSAEWIQFVHISCKYHSMSNTRKPSYRWQTRATRKPAKNCSNSMCLQRYRWQYWPIFIRLAVVASEICEIPRNSLKIQTYGVQGHPRSSILVSIESQCTTSY